MGLEPCEAHWGGQNTTAPRREAQGQDRSAAREDQACAPDYPVILPGPRCRLYYRLLSKLRSRAACLKALTKSGGIRNCIGTSSAEGIAPRWRIAVGRRVFVVGCRSSAVMGTGLAMGYLLFCWFAVFLKA